MRTLVTGGFGFIGAHLLEHLCRNSRNHIHAMDNLSTAPIPLDVLLGEFDNLANLSHTIGDMALPDHWNGYRVRRRWGVAAVKHSIQLGRSCARETPALRGPSTQPHLSVVADGPPRAARDHTGIGGFFWVSR